MGRVLVAVPYRQSTPAAFVSGAREHFTRLTWGDRELVMMPNKVTDPAGRKYGPNAIARNQLIGAHLQDVHTHVLWVDVDLVRVPADLIEQLLAVSDQDVVAPFVLVEKLNEGAPDWNNGGWFYDVGGFVRQAENASPWAPHFVNHTGGLIELDSVGCCYIVPAWVYRDGCRYDPLGDEVEHRSFMRQVRSRGVHVYATADVGVEHAFLPRYGEPWHG